MQLDVASFITGVIFMGIAITIVTLATVLRERKQIKMTPPDELTFLLPSEKQALALKPGVSIWSRRVEYVVDGSYGEKVFLKRKVE